MQSASTAKIHACKMSQTLQSCHTEATSLQTLNRFSLSQALFLCSDLDGKGSPTQQKTVYIWALPKLRFDPPYCANPGTLWHNHPSAITFFLDPHDITRYFAI